MSVFEGSSMIDTTSRSSMNQSMNNPEVMLSNQQSVEETAARSSMSIKRQQVEGEKEGMLAVIEEDKDDEEDITVDIQP